MHGDPKTSHTQTIHASDLKDLQENSQITFMTPQEQRSRLPIGATEAGKKRIQPLLHWHARKRAKQQKLLLQPFQVWNAINTVCFC